MIGIVLCGGQSSRMGSDKGMLHTDGISWTQLAVNKLSSLQIPVALSVNQQQYELYAATFPNTTIITDSETLNLHGPLLGVMTAHLKYPNQNLFVLACDMPLMEGSVLNELYSLYQQTDGCDGFVFTNNEEPEPLCAIYCAQGLAVIADMHQKGALKKHSMKQMIENLNIRFVPVRPDEKKYFANYNAHADLNGE